MSTRRPSRPQAKVKRRAGSAQAAARRTARPKALGLPQEAGPARAQGTQGARRGRPPEPGQGSSRAARKAAEEKVLLALRRVLTHLPPRAFKPGAALVGELGVDSLKVAELSIALEDAFGYPIFLGEVFAHVDDPSSLTVSELATFLAEGTR